MNTYELIISIIVSSITGIAASFFVWWFTVKHIRLKFSEKISKSKTFENKSGFKYRFKMENYGRRNIIDIEIIVRFRSKGLIRNTPNNWEVVYLPTSTLEYKKIAIMKPFSKSNLRSILEIKTYECDYFQNSVFPDDIIQKSRNKTLLLDDILDLNQNSEFQILIIGTDEFSGAKKFFHSKIYKKSDIELGFFDPRGLDIMPPLLQIRNLCE